MTFASRGLRGAERNYPEFSSFKLEVLALKWAVSEKFKAYTLGSHCTVFTDHNPLAHLKTANLGATEHRWVAQLAPFDIEVRYRSGRSNPCADALSRCPANMSSEETASVLHLAMDSTSVPKEIVGGQSPDVTLAPVTVMEGGLTSAILPSYSSEQLTKMQSEDPVLGELWNRWTAGWQPVRSAPNDELPGLQAWLSEWPNLSEMDGVLYRVSNDYVHGPIYQLLVPSVLRVIVLQAVHDQWGHQGVGRSYGLLNARCFWPGMSRQIRDYVRKCFHCTVAKAQAPVVRPPMRHLLAFKPLERLAIDFLKLDRGKGGFEDVLVMTDSVMKFAQAVPCKDQTAPVMADNMPVVCLFGHSFVKCLCNSSWRRGELVVETLGLKACSQVVEYGQGGLSFKRVLDSPDRYMNEICRCHPDLLVIDLGTNDLAGADCTVPDVVNLAMRFLALVDDEVHPKIIIILSVLLRTSVGNRGEMSLSTFNRKVKSFNSRIAACVRQLANVRMI